MVLQVWVCEKIQKKKTYPVDRIFRLRFADAVFGMSLVTANVSSESQPQEEQKDWLPTCGDLTVKSGPGGWYVTYIRRCARLQLTTVFGWARSMYGYRSPSVAGPTDTTKKRSSKGDVSWWGELGSDFSPCSVSLSSPKFKFCICCIVKSHATRNESTFDWREQG